MKPYLLKSYKNTAQKILAVEQNKIINQEGFTLIEIMVSVSIFITVMMIVIGALLMLNNASRKAQAVRVIVDNLNFALEDMTRNLMTGENYRCWSNPNLSEDDPSVIGEGLPCSEQQSVSGVRAISFRGQRELGESSDTSIYTCYIYALKRNPNVPDGNVRYRVAKVHEVLAGDIEPNCFSSSDFSPARVSRFVSPEAIIKDLKFFLSGKDVVGGQDRQPSVIIALNGEIDVSQYGFATPFNIQTTVSQRAF